MKKSPFPRWGKSCDCDITNKNISLPLRLKCQLLYLYYTGCINHSRINILHNKSLDRLLDYQTDYVVIKVIILIYTEAQFNCLKFYLNKRNVLIIWFIFRIITFPCRNQRENKILIISDKHNEISINKPKLKDKLLQ